MKRGFARNLSGAHRRTAHVLVCFAILLSPRTGLADADIAAQITALDREIVQRPDDGALFLRRADLHRLQRHWLEAEANYNRAAALHAPFEGLQLGRGLLNLESGKPKDAIPLLEELLALHPSHELGRVALARGYAATGQNDDALGSYARLQQETPRVDYYFEPAQMLAKADRITEAIQTLDGGIARLGLLPALDDLAIDLEVKRGNCDAALRRIDRRLTGTRRDEFLLVRKAEILHNDGRIAARDRALDEAEEQIRRLKPQHRKVPAVRGLESKIHTLRAWAPSPRH